MIRTISAALVGLFILASAPALATPDDELVKAVAEADIDSVKAALEAGADANTRNDKGAPVLFTAVQKKSAAIAEMLLEAGANPDAQYEAYIRATPLMMAVQAKDLALASMLLEYAANVNVADSAGDPAINWAAFYGYTDFVKLFLQYKADTSLRGHGNALEIVMRRGHQDLVSLLTDRKVAGVPTPDEALMIEAINAGDVAGVQEALQFGVSPDATDFTGRPILALAAREGHTEIVGRLLMAGATVNAEDLIGFTALHEAAREGKTEVVARLLEGGADAGHKSKDTALYLTPMHMAALADSADIIKLLASNGAEVDALGREKGTPLFWGIGDRKFASSLALLELGADPNITSTYGFSPADIAKNIGNTAILQKMGLAENQE